MIHRCIENKYNSCEKLFEEYSWNSKLEYKDKLISTFQRQHLHYQFLCSVNINLGQQPYLVFNLEWSDMCT